MKKYKMLEVVEDLLLIKRFVEIYHNTILYGELEIEPFTGFSLDFQAEYWYIKYYLLRNGKFNLNDNELTAFYQEKSLNILWLNVKDDANAIIECKDGDWSITILTQDKNSEALLDGYDLSNFF